MINPPEFKSFSKIPRFEGLQVIITQKIHGTNAQVYIEEIDVNNNQVCPCACHSRRFWREPSYIDGQLVHEKMHSHQECQCDRYAIYNNKSYKVYAGSRTRWLTPEDDNYGFAKWVDQNAQTLIEFLGEGRHYGEWAGPGINSGEGLKQKTFVLFEPWRYTAGKYEVVLPDDIKFVPIFNIPICEEISIYDYINIIMGDLKNKGSFLVPGYMFPEGIVITINGQRFKKTFAQEDVTWKPKKERLVREHMDYSYLCQPLRLDKLLSRDEKYLREYPKSLPLIVKDYVDDLIQEGIAEGEIYVSEPGVKIMRRAFSRQIFGFVKEEIIRRSEIIDAGINGELY